VENHTRKKIEILRLDNEGEYTSNDFKYFYKKTGIKRELTMSYNPQKNEILERNNWAMVGAAKEMIHDQNLLMFLWVENCNMIAYAQNISPHNILGDKTPKEAFFGVKPNIGHFCNF